MSTQNSTIDPLIRNFIKEAGIVSQSFGLGRVLGQIYAYLYFSQEPKSLGDLQNDLSISKGSASTIVRQLKSWDAVRKVVRQGERKDYYTAADNFGEILKRIFNDTVVMKINACTALLNEMEKKLPSANKSEEDPEQARKRFLLERYETLRSFHGRVREAWENTLRQKLLR